jgi:hypothetical protein
LNLRNLPALLFVPYGSKAGSAGAELGRERFLKLDVVWELFYFIEKVLRMGRDSIKTSSKSFRRAAKLTARRERAIQRRVDRSEKAKPKQKSGAMQAGARRYPEPPQARIGGRSQVGPDV